MIVNGFESANYRYFRNKETGKITKYSSEALERVLFSENFKSRLREYAYEYEIKPYPTDKEFDLLEYIRMQDPIVFKYDYYLRANFDTDDFFLMTEWLNNKMNSPKIINHFLGERVKESNAEMFQKLYEGERIGNINNFITMKEKKEVSTNIQELFKFRGPINGFKIPFQKEETWLLTNPAVSFLLLNQEFIREMYASEEILGEEKEMIFYEEYKDNIPNTKVRYYEIKDDVSVVNAYELASENNFEDYHYHYESLILRMYGNLLFCKENIENYRKDLTIRYISVEFFDSIYDKKLEEELLKIATRIPLEEALKRFQSDEKSLKDKKTSRGNGRSNK